MLGARPLVGSSTSSSFFGSTMARAIATICFWPPDRFPAGWFQNLRRAGKKPQIQSTRAASSGPLRAASTMFSRTVSSENTAMFSGT